MLHWGRGQKGRKCCGPAIRRICPARCFEKGQNHEANLLEGGIPVPAVDIAVLQKMRKNYEIFQFRAVSGQCQGLPASLLQGFETSDSSLAMSYALDFALLKRNGAVPDEILFIVSGEDLAMAEETRLRLSSEYPSPVRVSAVLRQKLGWSARQFERAVERKQIVSADGRDLKKCRMSQDWIIICRPQSM